MATEPIDLEVAGTCTDAAGSAIGMPQLCDAWFGNQIFWLLVTLVVIYFILSRIALPRIAAILAERQGTITNNIAAAEDLKAKALEAEAAYDQALADARAEAGRIIDAAKAEMKADLDVAIKKADAEIAERTAEGEKAIAEIREGALAAVKDVAKDTAKELIVALGGTADARTVTAAVNARMKG
ncbi:F0F1 ATP synthase subunit B' [Pseudosulfitobacter pseudonitzschiae]|uniref:ATP synthase subunit b n=1 Tax=Pseudosulfitobacter pseudonitzschiae TaxID=1402135 RepID=A0A073IXM0_9RHOB|nr:F0F1 ATP synthase subunit B' [Pseudosulfitobacter pseudonitzschiae]KEJ95078.1 ATP F0F1 synthase subunit B' [Pseudosulfitobacter pseudonitzschiae]MBM1816575.1 F0F1 ATP synthase subunit B' [Pseudosulfitobacter pseudonitzschiae]MBM1833173.1 F0F1 ATP synthase subunit B' [Pseudosulfitobacter pseudonitzschiae]MBM1838041.1 F0F1 ATP synthase subunit B' [Pseudosulfitobacter pseudonitzschiae]MBM1843302.1 F0F1 ATP synthase subunit B' [Pseudosulfitobacter pseudonitzschiae]